MKHLIQAIFIHPTLILGLLLALPLHAQTTTTDDFTTPSKWTVIQVSSPATALSVANGRMNYATTSSSNSGAIATWNGPKLPANQNWSLAADAHIDAFAMASFGQFVDVFLGVARTSDVLNTNVLLEFDRGNWGAGLGYDIGDSITVAGSEVTGILDEYNLTSPDVSLRLDYNATDRSLTYYFDSNGATGGYSWVSKGTLQLGPTFDSIGLLPTETFTVMLVGSSELQTVASGAASLSNLRVTVGGTSVTPPSITAHPAKQVIANGTRATLSVAASGSDLTYQWYEGTYGTTTTPVGPNSSSFITPALTKTTSYWIRVTNARGSVDSYATTVEVVNMTTLDEAIDQPPQSATNSGNLPWIGQTTVTHDCVDAARSGPITDSQTSEMSITVAGPNTVSFRWAVSSEIGGDYLRFFIDGVEQSGRISGGAEWTNKSYSVGAGSHTLKWAYTKNSRYSSGDDCGWVDQVTIGSLSPIPFVATRNPSGVALDYATLNGTVNPNDSYLTSAKFEYGLTNAYGSTVNVSSFLIPRGTSPQNVSATVYGLLPGVTYHYRLTATNQWYGEAVGNDATFHTEAPGPLHYKVDNGRVTIIGYTGSGGAVDIPSTINGMPVTGIGKEAFIRRGGLTSVTIPSSVTSIEASAFEECSGLTSVMIPNSVTSIGDRAFYYCSGLISVNIPASVSSIGAGAFMFCVELTSASIPASVTSIGYEAFYYCHSLASLVVDPANSAYSSMNGALFNKIRTILIQFPCGYAGAYSIPTGVTSIGGGAFFPCRGLTSVTIPTSVTSIGSYAFSECDALTSVTIPAGITSMGEYAFSGCGITSLTISAGVTSIGRRAFHGCSGLTSVTIPAGITSMEEYAFSGCGLTSVTISAGVTSIGNGAFSDCTVLTSITFPSSVTRIGDYTFMRCTGLTNVTFPSSVTSIGTYAFSRCSNLTNAILDGNAPTLGDSAFSSASSSFTIYFNPTSTGFTTPTWQGYPAVPLATKPVVATLAAIGITFGSATLNGTVNPNGLTSTAQFEYGLTTSYGSTAGVTLFPANGTTAQAVSAVLSGLQPGQTYHYRLMATNSGGAGTGADLTFATQAAASPSGTWLLAKGLPANTNLLTDPNGDGVSLLMAYAFNLNPAHNLSGSML